MEEYKKIEKNGQIKSFPLEFFQITDQHAKKQTNNRPKTDQKIQKVC